VNNPVVIGNATLYQGDALAVLSELPDESVQCCVTSPPYWGLRDYGADWQMGLEKTPALFVAGMVAVFEQVRRVLRDDGTLWLNLGDSYVGGGRGGNPDDSAFRKQATNLGSLVLPMSVPKGLKQKDLVGIPWRVAFALQEAGWYLRCDIIWHKPNPMPESVTDRPTKAHEYLFLLSKSPRYYYDAEAIKEASHYADHNRFGNKARLDGKGTGNMAEDAPEFTDRTGRNKRSVWTIATKPYAEAHFATYPPALIEPCVLAGSRLGDVVLDPFMGSGTTGEVALGLSRHFVGIDLSYHELSHARITDAQRQERLFA
jgi:DNA modification methylase